MTVEVNKEQIKDVVKAFITRDIQNEKEDYRHKSDVLDIVGIAEVEYLKMLHQTKSDHKAVEEALEDIPRFAENLYHELLNSTTDETVKDEDNKETVIQTIAFQLKVFILNERKVFANSFPVGNRVQTLEEAYVEHLKDLVNWAPPHVLTEYVCDRNLFVLARRMSEIYDYKGYTSQRGEQYFRLMYFLQGDPRNQEYGIRSVPGLDEKRLSKLVTRYVLTSELIKEKVETKDSAKEYYTKLRMWNGMTTYNKLEESEFKKAYIGALVLPNIHTQEKPPSLALVNALETVTTADAKIKGLPKSSVQGLVWDAINNIRVKGYEVKEVSGLTFIFGKRLVVLKGDNETLKILGSMSYTKANSGMLKKLIQK